MSTNPDMTLQWLRANGATDDDKTLADAWNSMLTQQLGIPKDQATTRQDMWFEVLGNLGYTGSISDRERAFWLDGGNLTLGEETWEDDFSDADIGIWQHTRGSGATGVDHTGAGVNSVGVDVPVFIGARYDGTWHDEGVTVGLQVEGAQSNAFTDNLNYTDGWTFRSGAANNGLHPTIPAPDGSLTALWSNQAGSGDSFKLVSGSSADRFSGWYRTVSGEYDIGVLQAFGFIGTINETWQKFDVSGTEYLHHSDGRRGEGATFEMLAWGVQVEEDRTVGTSTMLPSAGTASRAGVSVQGDLTRQLIYPDDPGANDFSGQFTYVVKKPIEVGDLYFICGTPTNGLSVYATAVDTITLRKVVDGGSAVEVSVGGLSHSVDDEVDIRFGASSTHGLRLWVDGVKSADLGEVAGWPAKLTTVAF